MAWYVPLTIIPGIGLLILSTTHLIVSLNAEISTLKKDREEGVDTIVRLKLAQLTRLSIAVSFKYLGVLFFLLSGVVRGLDEAYLGVGKSLLLGGVLLVSVSILILVVYSFKAVVIRRRHLM